MIESNARATAFAQLHGLGFNPAWLHLASAADLELLAKIANDAAANATREAWGKPDPEAPLESSDFEQTHLQDATIRGKLNPLAFSLTHSEQTIARATGQGWVSRRVREEAYPPPEASERLTAGQVMDRLKEEQAQCMRVLDVLEQRLGRVLLPPQMEAAPVGGNSSPYSLVQSGMEAVEQQRTINAWICNLIDRLEL